MVWYNSLAGAPYDGASVTFQVSPIFLMHAKEPGIQNHIHDVGSFTKVGRVAECENCIWTF